MLGSSLRIPCPLLVIQLYSTVDVTYVNDKNYTVAKWSRKVGPSDYLGSTWRRLLLKHCFEVKRGLRVHIPAIHLKVAQNVHIAANSEAI
jgi:hypothetical protein